MSLINDALRKARQEAAEQEAEEKGVAYRPPRAHLPVHSRMGLGVILGILLGFLSAFAGAYFLLRPDSPATRVVVETADAAQAAGKAAAATSLPVEPEQNEPEQPVGEVPPQEEASPRELGPPRSNQPPGQAQTESIAVEQASPVIAEPPPPQTAAPQPAAAAGDEPVSRDASSTEASSPPHIRPPERVGQVEDSNEFVLEADLGDIKLTLDFIVWIPGRPFAQINGNQVEEGQLVEELLVEKIERERVTLRGANGRLILRVR